MLNITAEEIREAAKILKNKVLPKIINRLDREAYDYNCWGFVAFTLNWDDLRWVGRLDMEKYLKDKTVPVPYKKVKNGDIAVYRADNWTKKRLSHTALITDAEFDMIIHKPGDDPLEMNTVYGNEYADKSEHDNVTVAFRRIKE